MARRAPRSGPAAGRLTPLPPLACLPPAGSPGAGSSPRRAVPIREDRLRRGRSFGSGRKDPDAREGRTRHSLLDSIAAFQRAGNDRARQRDALARGESLGKASNASIDSDTGVSEVIQAATEKWKAEVFKPLKLDIDNIGERMMAELKTEPLRVNLRMLPNCFRAEDAVDWLVKLPQVRDNDDAILVGSILCRRGVIVYPVGLFGDAKKKKPVFTMGSVYQFPNSMTKALSPQNSGTQPATPEKGEAGEAGPQGTEAGAAERAPAKAIRRGVFYRLLIDPLDAALMAVPMAFHLTVPMLLPLVLAYVGLLETACALVPFLMLFVHMVDRRRRTLFSNALHSEDQKKYFKDKDHETESAEWFSRVLDSLWDGWCRVWLSKMLLRKLNEKLDENCPSFLESIALDEFDLGAMAPMVRSARCYLGGMEDGVPETKLELDVELNTVDLKCILSAKLGGKNFAVPVVRLVASDVFISGKLRLGLGWTERPGGPYLKFLRVTFIDMPSYGLSIRPFAKVFADFGELPLINAWLDSVIKSALWYVVEPQTYLWDLEEWWWWDQEHPEGCPCEYCVGERVKVALKTGVRNPTLSLDVLIDKAELYNKSSASSGVMTGLDKQYYCKVKRGLSRARTNAARSAVDGGGAGSDSKWSECVKLDCFTEDVDPRMIIKLYKVGILSIGTIPASKRTISKDELIGVGVIQNVLEYAGEGIQTIEVQVFHKDGHPSGVVTVRLTCDLLVDEKAIHVVQKEEGKRVPLKTFMAQMKNVTNTVAKGTVGAVAGTAKMGAMATKAVVDVALAPGRQVGKMIKDRKEAKALRMSTMARGEGGMVGSGERALKNEGFRSSFRKKLATKIKWRRTIHAQIAEEDHEPAPQPGCFGCFGPKKRRSRAVSYDEFEQHNTSAYKRARRA